MAEDRELTRTDPGTASTAAPEAKRGSFRRRLYRIPVLGALAYLLWPPRSASRSLPRRAVSWTSGVVALLGIGMVAYPFAGQHYPGFYRVPVEKLIEWSNFMSDMQTNRIQDRLETEFAAVTPADYDAAVDGQPITRIVIPKLGVDTIVVEGTSPSALKAGAGHYPHTPLPGRKGNVAIAGHRTTYGRPFNRTEQLRPGDLIHLVTPVGKYTYRVDRNPWVTNPYDWSVVQNIDDGFFLTLTTCHPKGSARERLIVRAALVESAPAPAQAA